jgi:hypothetical protein
MKYVNDAIETTEIDACTVPWRKYVNKRECWFGESKSITKDDGTSKTRSP